jgi:hypothetical protein
MEPIYVYPIEQYVMKKQMRDKITILIKDYNIKKLQDLTAHILGMEKV